MGGKEYGSLVAEWTAKIPKRTLQLSDDAKDLTLKLGSVLGVSSCESFVRKHFDDRRVFCEEMDRLLGPSLGIEAVAPKILCPGSSGFFESVLQAAFGVRSPTHQDVQNLRILLVNTLQLVSVGVTKVSDLASGGNPGSPYSREKIIFFNCAISLRTGKTALTSQDLSQL